MLLLGCFGLQLVIPGLGSSYDGCLYALKIKYPELKKKGIENSYPVYQYSCLIEQNETKYITYVSCDLRFSATFSFLRTLNGQRGVRSHVIW